MNFYEKELRAMFERDQAIKDKQFAGRVLLGRLGDKLLVKVQFIPSLAADHYNALQVILLNRGKGFVDKENFLFRDLIGPQRREDLGEVEPHVWEYGNKPAWFIPITEAQRRKIADTVLGYIRLFQSENG